MTNDIQEAFTETNLRSMFSDCIDSGAGLKLNGDVFVLEFPEAPKTEVPPVFSFSLVDDDTVLAFTEIPGLSGSVPADQFLGGIDIISAKILTAFDHIDRGV